VIDVSSCARIVIDIAPRGNPPPDLVAVTLSFFGARRSSSAYTPRATSFNADRWSDPARESTVTVASGPKR
jgi:hypothetical protein